MLRSIVILGLLASLGHAATPVFVAPSPEQGAMQHACVGQPLRFTIEVHDADTTMSAARFLSITGSNFGSTATPNNHQAQRLLTTGAWGVPASDSDVAYWNRSRFVYERTEPSFVFDKPACFQSDNGGVERPERCVTVRTQVPPVVAPVNTRQIRVGDTMSLVMSASDENVQDNVRLDLLEDPGLPNGASVSTQTCVASPGKANCNTAQRTVTWTPAAGQDRSYRICLRARDDSNTVCGNYTGPTYCADVVVYAPVPAFRAPPDSTYADGAAAPPATVGCPFSLRVAAVDTNPPPRLTYAVDIAVDATAPLPAGASLGALAGGGEGAFFYRTVSWTPRRGQEGHSWTSCFLASDTLGAATVRTCVVLSVRRCRVCTSGGDTLLRVAREYKTDWRQLWAANPHVRNPDAVADSLAVPESTQELHLGPVYTLQASDTLSSVAARFGFPLPRLLSVNPDIADAASVAPGQAVCLMPGVCDGFD